ncbi:hypothetical protein RAZWK3B_01750 [Roseobacter sp. AzwK-3b]|nr:hypothetical protein RAZWK3B_01750 [Roseobacter sp. AzwK-3b]
MACAGHLDMIGQLEPAFECAGRDAAMQEGAGTVILGLAGGDEKRAVTDLDAQVAIGEAGNGDRDAIGVIGVFSIL